MTNIPSHERQRLYAEAIVEYTRGDRTKSQMDFESYHYGPESQPSPHPHPPAERKQHWLWSLVRRIAWGRWD
jgi:hypothetical protein